MCEQGILDRGVSEGCDFRRLDTYEEGTPPPDRVHLPRREYTSPDRAHLQVGFSKMGLRPISDLIAKRPSPDQTRTPGSIELRMA